MADINANNFTVTVTERWQTGRKKYSRGSLALVGTDNYVAAGVPLPAISNFGFTRQMDSLNLDQADNSANAYTTHFDSANQKLLLYRGGAANAALAQMGSAAVGNRTWNFLASGW